CELRRGREAGVSATRQQRPLVFCATGVERTAGGIASANRNVLAALERLGDEVGAPVEVLLLLEESSPPDGGDRVHRKAFGGHKAAFARAVLSALVRARLVVFDHVHLSLPMLLVPSMLRTPVAICAHGSEVGRRVRPLSRRA